LLQLLLLLFKAHSLRFAPPPPNSPPLSHHSQAVFDCNLDFNDVCEPKISYVRMDEAQDGGSPLKAGYNFKHVRYTTVDAGGAAVNYRHTQHLTGYRIVFDLNGSARQFDFSVLLMTLGIGLAVGAVGFLVIDQIRQNLERIYLKTREERGEEDAEKDEEARLLLANNQYDVEDHDI
jgi:hypothetical protein